MGTRSPIHTPSKSASQPSEPRGSPSSEVNPTAPRDNAYEDVLSSSSKGRRRASGRQPSRNLIRWIRPRMTDKLLLHIQYECARRKIQLPWDAIANRLHPGSSGAAVTQHMARLRRDLLSKGHLVPPVAGKTHTAPGYAESEIRGFVRQDVDGDDKTTRPVTFSEELENLKFKLPRGLNPDEDDTAQCECSGEEDELPGVPPPPTWQDGTHNVPQKQIFTQDAVVHGLGEGYVPIYASASCLGTPMGCMTIHMGFSQPGPLSLAPQATELKYQAPFEPEPEPDYLPVFHLSEAEQVDFNDLINHRLSPAIASALSSDYECDSDTRYTPLSEDEEDDRVDEEDET